MISTYRIGELAKLREQFGFSSDKSLGQNFLIDGNTVARVADAAELSRGDTVIEIGAGVGALTGALSERAGRVIAVETDRRLIPALEAALADRTNIEIANEDFLKYDMNSAGGVYKLVGNLPYNITTPVIVKAFEAPSPPSLMVFMMQKEVAERITAPPGGRIYGAISVLAQYRSETELLFSVSREVFRPKPNVDSAVVRFRTVSRDVPAETEKTLFQIVKAGFGQRRKTLRNSLKALGADEAVAKALDAAGVDPGLRAETLSWKDYLRIAEALRSCGFNG
jgi:16S rRNA (adenine1518-N6/adenine1519-N6)-dimethyltransferase